jgi:hypothetical protein
LSDYGSLRLEHVCDADSVVSWSSALGMIVSVGTRVCSNCWHARKQLPNWTDNVAARSRLPPASRALPVDDASTLATALRAAWQRVLQLHATVRELCAQQHQQQQLVADAVPAAAASAAAMSPAALPAAAAAVSLGVGVPPAPAAAALLPDRGGPAAAVHFSPLDDWLGRNVFIHSFTGAPNAAAFSDLLDTVTTRSPQWPHRSVSRRDALFVALCHLRLHIPYAAAASVINAATSSAFTASTSVLDTLAGLAVDTTVVGAVRFLSDAEIDAAMSAEMQLALPGLRLIADCTPIFVQRPVQGLDLCHLLYDGEQYSDTWVKYFVACAPHGYVMHVAGPFAPAGRAPDGNILPFEVQRNDAFRAFAQRGGVWLADYGFRGAQVPAGVDLRMPRRVPADEQLSGDDNDWNRGITRWRWVVEAANQRLKTFRYFKDVLGWQEIPNFYSYMLVVCFLFNRWYKPLVQEE